MFHWSVHLLCQFHAVLNPMVLEYSLMSGGITPLVLFFYLEVAVAICGLLWLHIKFKIICSSSVQNAICSDKISLNLEIAVGIMGILTILILPIHEHSKGFHLLIPSPVSFSTIFYFSKYMPYLPGQTYF